MNAADIAKPLCLCLVVGILLWLFGCRTIRKSPPKFVGDTHTNPQPPIPRWATNQPSLPGSQISDLKFQITPVRTRPPSTNQPPHISLHYYGIHTNTLVLETSPDLLHWKRVTTFPPSYGTLDWESPNRATNARMFYRLNPQ